MNDQYWQTRDYRKRKITLNPFGFAIGFFIVFYPITVALDYTLIQGLTSGIIGLTCLILIILWNRRRK